MSMAGANRKEYARNCWRWMPKILSLIPFLLLLWPLIHQHHQPFVSFLPMPCYLCIPKISMNSSQLIWIQKYMRNAIFKRKTNGFFVIFARCFCRTNVPHIAFDHFSVLFFILFMQRYICANTIIFLLIQYSHSKHTKEILSILPLHSAEKRKRREKNAPA